MTINYTTLLGLAEPVTGTESGVWGDDVNKGITEYLDIAIAGTQTISGSQTAVTLSLTNGSSAGNNIAQAGTGTTGSAQYSVINCTGNPASTLTITVPASSRQYIVINATSTSQSVKIVGAGPTTGVTLKAGARTTVAWNGSDFVELNSFSNGVYSSSTFAGSYSDGIVMDYTTGLGRISVGTSDGIAFYNGGVATTELMRLDASGNLGVGTSSPTTRLQVGDATVSSANKLTLGKTTATTEGTLPTVYAGSLINPAAGVDLVLEAGSSSGGVAIRTGGSTRAVVDSAGNLGLGVTPSAWATTSGRKAFDIGSYSALVGLNGAVLLTENATFNGVSGSGWVYRDALAASYYQQTSGQHQWYNAASGSAGANISFTQAMTLDASGKLLIGTTSAITGPYWGTASNLYVTGTYGVGSFSSFVNSNSGGGLVFQKSRNTTVGSHTIVQNNDFLMDISIEGSDGSAFRSAAGISCQVDGSTISASSMPGRLVFSTTASGSVSATERARIDSSGNLMVGDTANSSGSRFYAKGSTASSGGYTLFARNSSAVDLFSVRDDGAGYLKAASWTYGSDASLKENIQYLTPEQCLELLIQAKPAKFDYIEGEKDNYGYIANDVETWLPEAVPTTPSGTRGLKDGFINVLGTGAIQALNQIIQEQQAIITTLTERITALEEK